MRKLKFSVLIVILVCLLFGIVNANNNQLTQEMFIKNLLAENEDNPESKMYLVTDDFISRVSPKTNIQQFKENFEDGEIVKVYEDETCQKEIENGYVYSGMYAKYINNDRIFKISVFGDINAEDKGENNIKGDGFLNQIELTRDIRHYVTTEGWKISEAEERESADITCDKTVDDEDIKHIIQYIVYDKLQIPEVKKVQSPKIEITQGDIDADGKYSGSVKLKITQLNKKENTKKTIYKITGSKIQDYIEIDGEEQEIELSGEGIYKVTAYTYGELENKSKGVFQLIKIGSEKDVNYAVEYYYQVNGIYKNTPDERITRTAKTDTEVFVQNNDKKTTKEGYVFDETKNENLSVIVERNGSSVLKVYFKEQFTVTYKPGTKGTFEEERTENIDWGTQTPVFNGELTHQEGYEFNGWDKTLADKVTEDIEYIATWKAKEYNIVYTLNGGSLGTDNNGSEITNKASYNIETENFTLNNPSREGYEFKGWTGTGLNAESKNVTIEKGSMGDREYTANWTAINYTITYELNGGDLGSDERGNKITNPTTYNIETPDFELNNPKRIGYTFIGWTGTELSKETTLVIVRNGSKGNRNYEANWQVNTNVEYKVKFYKEKLESQDSTNKNNYELEEEKTHFGTTDQSITLDVDENKYKGFTYSPEISIVSGTIRGDGKLVLEVYYSRNSYTLKLEKDENVNRVEGSSIEKNLGTSIDEATGKALFKYGQKIKINADLKTEDGYDITFIKWESKNPDLLDDKFDKNTNFEMPAGNLTLKATSNKIAKTVGYTVEYYYQLNGTYSDTPDYTNTARKAETDVEVFVTENDKKPNSERQGYTFDETKNGSLSGRVKGDGTLVLKVYFKQQFTVTYKSGEHGTFKYGEEEKIEEKYEKLDYNSTTPNLIGTLTAKKGYEFANWNKEVQDKVTENSEYIANWNVMQYNISYNLNGGDLGLDNSGNAITNPTSYTVETNTFTLNNPNKPGYRFLGWTGTDLTEENSDGQTVDKLTEQVTIEKGSTGDKEYTANWEAIEYTITYNLDGGNLLEGATNPEKYTVETNTFTLNNPSKPGYKFLGWTGTRIDNEINPEETTPLETVTIEKGSTGNRKYTAKWQANTETKYHVQYYLEKLESTDKNNAENYILKDEVEDSGTTNSSATAEIKEYKGFTYDEENRNNIISGTITGDEKLVLKVYYSRNSYTLTLDKDENVNKVTGKSIDKNIGISVDENTLKATFKYEQPIEIEATLKEVAGYEVTFKAWESSSTTVLNTQEEKEKQKTIFTMPAEDVTAKATSDIEANTVEYTVEYYYEGDDGYPQTATYTNEDTRTAKVGETVRTKESDQTPDARKPGYVFDDEN
ncbi:MAG TPA: hypothetical protein DCZ30_04490, partial [Clostridiales bacterium]|nr:hypothetical protein [Clostridiales bacterium]